MMTDTFPGMVLLILGGMMNASFTLPMKFTRRWSWENTWLAWTLFALLVLAVFVLANTSRYLD